METTQLYIELIIIGIEGFIWMCTFLVDIIGYEATGVLAYILGNFSASLLLVGILYIIGILLDRFADIVFQKKENTIRNKSGLYAKNTALVWKKYDAVRYAEFSRTRVKILRASVLNLPLISLGFILYAMRYLDKSYMIVMYILFLGMLFTYVSWKSYDLSLIKYYNKTRELELSEKEDK